MPKSTIYSCAAQSQWNKLCDFTLNCLLTQDMHLKEMIDFLSRSLCENEQSTFLSRQRIVQVFTLSG